MTVLGIDPSTKTGLVVLDVKDSIPVVLFSKEASFPKLEGFHKISAIADELLSLLDSFNIDRIVIEGYSYNSKYNIVNMVEIGAILRYFLIQEGYDYIEVAPNQLKKFATGKGKDIKKQQMLLEVYKKWGFSTHNDNICDAFALACVGLGLDGHISMNKIQEEIIHKIKIQCS